MKKPRHRLGDAPIEADNIEQLEDLARVIDHGLNGLARGADRPNGFVLLVFPFGSHDGARCNIISNGADPANLVSLFRGMAKRIESMPEVKPGKAPH